MSLQIEYDDPDSAVWQGDYIWQEFTVDESFAINGIEFYCSDPTPGPGTQATFTVSVCVPRWIPPVPPFIPGYWDWDAEQDLGTFTLYNTDPAGWYGIQDYSGDAYELSPGTTYAVRLRAVGTYYAPKWTYDSTDSYANGTGYWYRASFGYVNYGDWSFRVYGVGGPAKATNPSPAHEATQDGCYDRKLSWSMTADTCDVYVGTSEETLTLYSEDQTETEFTVDEEDWFQDSYIYWRVNTKTYGGTTTGDVWWFDPTPGAATNPTPSDTTTNVSIEQSRLYWDGGKLYQTFDVYIDDELVGADETTEYYDLNDLENWPLSYYTTYTWHVMTKNLNGSTDSASWTFTTAPRRAPYPSYTLIDGGSGLGPTQGGVLGTDFEWTGLNFMATVNKLVVAANNKIWVSDDD